jgi:hypothetical protein
VPAAVRLQFTTVHQAIEKRSRCDNHGSRADAPAIRERYAQYYGTALIDNKILGPCLD